MASISGLLRRILSGESDRFNYSSRQSMSSSEHTAQGVGEGAGAFRTTHWSVVLAASHRNAPNAQDALAKLCQTYWYPLYAYVRRRGHDSHDAEDLTQEFFARLLDKNYLDGITRQGGRFRSYLLTTLKHFLANEWERARTQKRGGGKALVSLDDQDAESRYRFEPADSATPEILFERRWALTVLDQVMVRLREEQAALPNP